MVDVAQLGEPGFQNTQYFAGERLGMDSPGRVSYHG